MKLFRYFPVVLFSLLIAKEAGAQVYFHLGPAIPLADFASDDVMDDAAGGASIGPIAGLRFIHPVSPSGIGLFGGIDLAYNWLQKDMRDEVDEIYSQMGIGAVDIDYYKYFNIPIMGGINYTLELDEVVSVFANVGVTVNVLKITDMQINVGPMSFVETIEPVAHVGIDAGTGILINGKTALGIDFLGLGEHDVNGEMSGPGLEQDVSGKLKINMLTLSVGFRL